MLLEATRRSLGPPLMFIAILFLVYTFAGPYMPDVIAHRGASFQRAMSQQWLSAEGVFGIALGVSTSFVFLFVLFGAMLERAGAGNYFIQVAFALLGHLRGGPAKAAVVASGMTGLISGSSIANTVTTGTFTIPLMKRVGFSAEKAGAVEVVELGQRPDHAAGDGRGRLPHGGIRRHPLRRGDPPRLAAGGHLLHRAVLHRPPRGAEGRHGGPAAAQPLDLPAERRLLRHDAGRPHHPLAAIVYYGIGWTRDVFGETANYIVAAGVLAAYFGLLWVSSRVPTLELDDPDSPLSSCPRRSRRSCRDCTSCCRSWC
jgi:hypothetical protein